MGKSHGFHAAFCTGPERVTRRKRLGRGVSPHQRLAHAEAHISISYGSTLVGIDCSGGHDFESPLLVSHQGNAGSAAGRDFSKPNEAVEVQTKLSGCVVAREIVERIIKWMGSFDRKRREIARVLRRASRGFFRATAVPLRTTN
jgi:hypothetical protein